MTIDDISGSGGNPSTEITVTADVHTPRNNDSQQAIASEEQKPANNENVTEIIDLCDDENVSNHIT